MANKYHVTNLDNFNLETDGQNYNVNVTVDSLDFITLEFGSSFSIRVNYNEAEKIESVLKTARYLIQDQHIDNAGKSMKQSNDTPDNWNPSDPTNW